MCPPRPTIVSLAHPTPGLRMQTTVSPCLPRQSLSKLPSQPCLTYLLKILRQWKSPERLHQSLTRNPKQACANKKTTPQPQHPHTDRHPPRQSTMPTTGITHTDLQQLHQSGITHHCRLRYTLQAASIPISRRKGQPAASPAPDLKTPVGKTALCSGSCCSTKAKRSQPT